MKNKPPAVAERVTGAGDGYWGKIGSRAPVSSTKLALPSASTRRTQRCCWVALTQLEMKLTRHAGPSGVNRVLSVIDCSHPPLSGLIKRGCAPQVLYEVRVLPVLSGHKSMLLPGGA